jgi:hypothetical protein
MTDVVATEPQQTPAKVADDELKGLALQELEGEDLEELLKDPRTKCESGEGLIDLDRLRCG